MAAPHPLSTSMINSVKAQRKSPTQNVSNLHEPWVVVVVVVVQTVCRWKIPVDKTITRVHLIQVAGHLGVRPPATPPPLLRPDGGGHPPPFTCTILTTRTTHEAPADDASLERPSRGPALLSDPLQEQQCCFQCWLERECYRVEAEHDARPPLFATDLPARLRHVRRQLYWGALHRVVPASFHRRCPKTSSTLGLSAACASCPPFFVRKAYAKFSCADGAQVPLILTSQGRSV